MLRKVLKYDIKSVFLQLAILFGLTLIIPLIAYFVSLNASVYTQTIIREFTAFLLPVLTVLLTVIWLGTALQNDLNGKNAYLIHTIPVKVKTLLLSKCIVFYVCSVLSILFAMLCYTIVYMDFMLFEEIFDYIESNLSHVSGFEEHLVAVLIALRLILAPVGLFSYGCAITAFGHLFGTKKVIGELLFTGATLVFLGLAGGFAVKFISQYDISFEMFLYIDSVISIALTVGFFIFTNYVFTKKINVI